MAIVTYLRTMFTFANPKGGHMGGEWGWGWGSGMFLTDANTLAKQKLALPFIIKWTRMETGLQTNELCKTKC